MPLQRISDLTAGSPPYSGAALVEVSVPTGASPPYVSRSAQVSDLLAAGGTLTGVTAGTGVTVSGAAPSPTVALTSPVSVANGGTGSTTAAAALTALGAVAKAGDTMTGALVVRTNAAALPAPPAGTVLQAGGTDANPARIVVDAFGGGSNNPMLQFRSAGGTAATRTPTQSGDTLGNIIWQGYGTTGIPAGGKAQIAAFATQAWTDAANGTAMNFIVTANGGTASAEAMRIDHNGNVGIGGTPLRKLHVFAGNTAGVVGEAISAGVNGADSTTIMLNLMDGTSAVAVGAINRTGTNSVAYATTSDERLKDSIAESNRGLDALMAIKVSDYRMGDTEQQGLLAQDVHKVYPEAVIKGGDDPNLQPWMIDYGRLTPLLIKALQEAMARIEALEGKPA